MTSFFEDGPEFLERKSRPFKPTTKTLAEVRAAVPKKLTRRSTFKALLYVTRTVCCAYVAYQLAWLIDGSTTSSLFRWSMWAFYWYWQSIIFTGFFTMGHDAGHTNLSSRRWANDLMGFPLHTFIFVPYYSWRSSHLAHHKAATDINREENYVPRLRSDYPTLPAEHEAKLMDYHELFEDAPTYTLLRMLMMQALGWYSYLFTNHWGSHRYPPGTNHFSPSSALFKPHERNAVLVSNIALSGMACVLYTWARQAGLANFFKLYFIPYSLTNHWIIMMTYLHHTDPTMPMYRGSEWSFLRGALATVDRPFLGWAGRIFLNNVSHDHIAHHLFSTTPFYNLPKVTERLKEVLGEEYNYDSTSIWRALWRNFTMCCFVEDEGDIVFYKGRDGQVSRTLSQ